MTTQIFEPTHLSINSVLVISEFDQSEEVEKDVPRGSNCEAMIDEWNVSVRVYESWELMLDRYIEDIEVQDPGEERSGEDEGRKRGWGGAAREWADSDVFEKRIGRYILSKSKTVV